MTKTKHMLQKSPFSVHFLIVVLLTAVLAISAQNLTIRDIMAEPSIAGMRVEGEKLSPDGTKVVFLWNAAGKMPRDLYLVSTSGGTPSVILRTSDLPVPTRTPQQENKLDQLERPLLILHGMSDDNVHVQDSVQMMEKLIRLGKTKYFEAMLYPSENHGFVRPESWTDEYERIFSFFEKHLK